MTVGEAFGCALAVIGGTLSRPGNALANLGIQIANRSIDRAAIAMEARQGGDGETRPHPKDDSAGLKGIAHD